MANGGLKNSSSAFFIPCSPPSSSSLTSSLYSHARNKPRIEHDDKRAERVHENRKSQNVAQKKCRNEIERLGKTSNKKSPAPFLKTGEQNLKMRCAK